MWWLVGAAAFIMVLMEIPWERAPTRDPKEKEESDADVRT